LRPAAAQPSFINFESGQVRPIALSPDGSRLFVANTPDSHLEIFDVGVAGITHSDSVPVGMEPVAIAARNNGEVWVVNHLSDSVSVVDVLSNPPRVTRTLLVGDEPRDIVFAGTGGDRAFIATAHRGQHRTHSSIAGVAGSGDPQLTTAGIDRADVWVFDASSPGAAVGGIPLAILSFFTDTPRALAVSNDGNKVYVAGFNTGNQTTTITEPTVCDGFTSSTGCSGDGITSPGGLPGGQLPGGNPGPSTDVEGVTAPEVGLIVRLNNATGTWEDELGRNWNNGVRFDLPDRNVFAIDANTLSQIALHAHVGTTLFNMAVHPATGDLFITNTESINQVRFEGPGVFGGSTVQGHLAESRITVIDNPDVTDATGASIKPRHLNKHLDYGTLANDPGFDATAKQHSLAIPVDLLMNAAGTQLYVAAFGSSKVGVLDPTELESDAFDPTLSSPNYIDVSGGGPSGLAIDETNGRLYVLTRFDNSVSVVDLTTGLEEDHQPLHNPEPTAVVEGRPFLYDAFETSANGETSCASCHIFGDMDQIGWDLGNPDDAVASNPMVIKLEAGADSSVNGGAAVDEFHPMKGPMTTQTLRGLATSGPMHWRGDRSNGFFGMGTDEALSFDNFIVAFEGLVGRAEIISESDMNKFTSFALTITLPPNPVRAIDNSLTTDQQGGEDFFLGTRKADGLDAPDLGFTCDGCHELDASQGFFGTNGDASFENEQQIIKIPHLRNLYQKVGMFGMPDTSFINAGDNGHKGDQIRGFGFLHDGSIDTLFRFFKATVFDNTGSVGFDGPADGDVKRAQMEQFVLAFDSDLAPVVGQQVTLDSTNAAIVGFRIDTLIQRANAAFTSEVLGGAVTECDLIVTGVVSGEMRGWVLNADGTFTPDRAGDPALTDEEVRSLAATPGQEASYTCVPPGSGIRMGIDRDEDGVLNGDESKDSSSPSGCGCTVTSRGDGVLRWFALLALGLAARASRRRMAR
jgi:YVTN family beta-propeller protein